MKGSLIAGAALRAALCLVLTSCGGSSHSPDDGGGERDDAQITTDAGGPSDGGARSDAGNPPQDGGAACTNTLCGSECVDTDNSEAHCGSCDHACATGQTCNSGDCQCPGEQEVCGGACVDVTTSGDHCGECDRQCDAGNVCSGGICGPECGGETPTRCGDVCVDINTDSNHCGGCVGAGGVACATPPGSEASCVGGMCVAHCAPGFADCNDESSDGCELNIAADPTNCGGCGISCGTQACVDSACVQGSVDLREHCGVDSEILESFHGEGCFNVTVGIGRLSWASSVVGPVTLFSGTDCSGSRAAVTGETNLCGTVFSDGSGTNDRVNSIFLGSLPPVSCAQIHASDPSAADGVYLIDPDGIAGSAPVPAFCDMTTDGGGWTLCGRIDERGIGNLCVLEGGYRDVAALTNQSYCVQFFQDQSPRQMMIHNLTVGDDTYGEGDRILFDWSGNPIVPGVYDDRSVSCRHLDDDGVTITTFPACQYSSHGGLPWQHAMWSFTNGVNNGYADNFTNRIVLGPTYSECDNGGYWHSWGADTTTAQASNVWGDTENVGDLYLR